ncbi:AAA family ATPase [Endothiovibrio diazotrophicus]
MIIHALRAENILKYESLAIDDLPERGLFAISGENESGKSTIGETICFALFGRTFSLGPGRIAKVIRWNQSRGRVEIEFTGRDGVRCRLERHIDVEGNHGALLSVAGEEVAKGSEAVLEAVMERIGFGFDEFVESFYLAQREITAPHPHSHAVKVIAGVAPLEAVSEALAGEILGEQERIIGIEQEIAEIESRIEALGVQEDGLERLEQERDGRLAEEREQEEAREEWLAVPGLTRESSEELAKVAQLLLGADRGTSCRRWEEHAEALGGWLDGQREQYADTEGVDEAIAALQGLADGVAERRTAFEPLRERIAVYRGELGALLGEDEAEEGKTLGTRIADAGRRLRSLGRRRGLDRFLALLTFLLGGAAGAAWWLLVLEPERAESGVLRGYLHTFVPGWETDYLPWLPHAFGVLVVLFLLAWLRSLALGGRMRREAADLAALEARLAAVQVEAESLDGIDRRPLPEAVAYLKELEDEGIAEALQGFLDGPGAELLDEEWLGGLRERLASDVAGFDAAMRQLAVSAVDEVAAIEQGMATIREALAEVESRIAEERERRRQADELRTLLAHMPTRIERHREAIDRRELARDLLAGSFRHTTQRFNRETRKLVAETLPRLTEGRYEHLQIDDELKVRVFSTEKQDFLELDEISSGTQRQIMLAVRLALSQELVETAGLARQFLFLDEPFAFFDMARMRSSLGVLPELSDELSQIWVISQEFPEEVAFDLHVHCARGITTLRLP